MTELQVARLQARAIKKQWDIPDDYKRDVINSLHEIATMGEKESARVAACRGLLEANSQNQKDEHKVIDAGIATRNSELDAIAADLGIDKRIVIDANGSRGVGNSADEESAASN